MSSTEGSPTKICWNRRSRAGSFSIRSRYSSSVVAPTMRSSPRASMGLSMLPASMAPSAAPAPTTVCSSSMNVMTWPSLSLISASTAFSRSSNSPRYLAPATIAPRSSATTRLSLSDSGTSPATIRWARPSTTAVLPTPGLADQHRVVLGPAGQHLDHPPDLGVPADDRVELALAGAAGQVDPVLLQCLVGALRVLAGDPGGPADLLERGEQLVRSRAGLAQHGRCLAAVGGQAHEQVLGGDVLVAHLAGPLLRGVERGEQRPRGLRGAQRGAGRPRQPGQAFADGLQHRRRVGAHGLQQRVRRSLVSARSARPAGAGRRRSGSRPRRRSGSASESASWLLRVSLSSAIVSCLATSAVRPSAAAPERPSPDRAARAGG